MFRLLRPCWFTKQCGSGRRKEKPPSGSPKMGEDFGLSKPGRVTGFVQRVKFQNPTPKFRGKFQREQPVSIPVISSRLSFRRRPGSQRILLWLLIMSAIWKKYFFLELYSMWKPLEILIRNIIESIPIMDVCHFSFFPINILVFNCSHKSFCKLY